MTTVSRFTIAAAFSALTTVACSSAPTPEEPASVDVQTDQVDPNCVKGGGLCGVVGRGGSAVFNPSGGQLVAADPTPPPPPPGKGYEPEDCGECRWDTAHYACVCSGVGYGLSSTIGCPYSHPCALYVWGAYRCYDRLSSGYCPN